MHTSIGKSEDGVRVVLIDQRTEETEEVLLNTAQLTALFQAKQLWIEKFGHSLKIENTIWSYGSKQVTLQVYLK